MRAASPVESPENHASPHAIVFGRRADTDDLGEAIAALAARLHAATDELLVLLREFDARKGWTNGFLSCAHWPWPFGCDDGAADPRRWGRQSDVAPDGRFLINTRLESAAAPITLVQLLESRGEVAVRAPVAVLDS